MKILMKKLSNSFFLLFILYSFNVTAKPVAQVTEVKGQVFGVIDGKTKALKINDHIEDQTEVMVGEGASVTLNDYFDASYNLIEGGHLKFMNQAVLLKNGKTWIRATNSRHSLNLLTANGIATFSKGDFITTFETINSRTQFLVINGQVEVSNLWDKNFKYSVTGGHFSLIDPKIENGTPRSPTKVGFESLNKSLADFKILPQELKLNEPARKIASVESSRLDSKLPRKGRIIFMMNGRLPASVMKKDEVQKNFSSKTNAPINFYGINKPSKPKLVKTLELKKAKEIPRFPASIPKKELNLPTKVAPQLNIESDFSESLRKHYVEQPKYSKELENLLQDLKSF